MEDTNLGLIPGRLVRFFEENRKVALCFSGGTDSCLLLYVARHLGVDILPIFADTVFSKSRDREWVTEFCAEIDLEPVMVHVDVMVPDVVSNGPERCRHCKMAIMSAMVSEAYGRGYGTVIDGTNASDDESQRPGMKVLGELGISSPLRYSGITKADVRRISHAMGIPGWDRHSDSCLATRVIPGVAITSEMLGQVERSEAIVGSMGFSGFRVRTDGDHAEVRFHTSQQDRALDVWDDIRAAIEPYFNEVVMGEPRS